MQFRFHTFQRPLDSFEENLRTLGMMQAGRYRGYDTFNQTGALAGDLLHTITGVDKTDLALAVTPDQAALVTPQGVMIYETAAIPLAGFTTNAGNNDRLDLIILEHEYLDSVGGQAATYSIIVGIPASGSNDIPVAPALTNPEKQVIIGTMFIPGGDANLNNAIYTAGVPTKLNGQGLALLDQAQQYTKMQSSSKGTDIEVDANKLIKLKDDGNLFICTLNNSIVEYMEDKPEGTTIRLVLKTGSQSSTTFVTEFPSAPVGYLRFILNGDDDLVFANRTILEFTRVSYPFDSWQLVSAGIDSFDIKVLAVDLADVVAGELPAGVKTDGTLLKTKVIEIGDWDMDADDSVTVIHGISSAAIKARQITILILTDTSAFSVPLSNLISGGNVVQGVFTLNNSAVLLRRETGGDFDNINFDSTSFNRGWITITYEA